MKYFIDNIFEISMSACMLTVMLIMLGMGVFGMMTYDDRLAVKMEMAKSCQSFNTHKQ